MDVESKIKQLLADIEAQLKGIQGNNNAYYKDGDLNDYSITALTKLYEIQHLLNQVKFRPKTAFERDLTVKEYAAANNRAVIKQLDLRRKK
jgi:hypothetical protein